MTSLTEQGIPPSTRRPDDPFLSRARAGDAEAFRTLYDRHHARVYGLALRATRDPVWAEELTQEVFVQVWQSLPRFRGDSAFATWLHRLALNVIWSRIRRGNRRALWITTDPEPDGITSSPAERIGMVIDIDRALAALPRGARLVLILHDIEGYRYSEIAASLGISMGTVRSQLHRARRLMMESLQ